MPTYDYKCDACGVTFEKFQSITAAPIKQCPECKKQKVRRLIGTGAGLIFKGSGFYITDYRDSGYKDAAKKESGSSEGSSTAEAKSGSDAAAKSADTKPAAESKPAESRPAATPPKPAAPTKASKKK